VLARGLASPVHVVATRAEPGRLYVVEQRGTIRVLQRGRLRPGLFLDLRSRVSTEGNEQGLLGLAFDPRYARNRFVYVNYTDSEGDTRVVRYRTNGVRALPRTARLLLAVEQPHSNHNGGNLVFGPDGLLYVGLGDGGGSGDPEDRAQSTSSFLGKLLTLDVRRPGRRPVIVALGLRNPWRYSFDRATGDLYLADVGWRQREEVDYLPRVSPGLENFGWDVFEGSVRLSDKSLSAGRLVEPIHEYDHDAGCSVTGGFVYRGRAVAAERGRYFFGDYCEGTIWSLVVRDGRAADVRTEAYRVPELTSFGEDAAGELYAASRDGTIYRLSR
jgi:glucose/arabinose dehydrogenase